MRVLLTLTIISLGITSILSGPVGEGCSSENLACGNTLLLYGSDTSLPEDLDGLKQACDEELAAEQCARGYAEKCLESFPKGIAIITLDSVKAELVGKCNSSLPRHKEYLEHIPCLNKAGVGINGCIQDLLGKLNVIAENAPNKKKIPYTCCNFATFRQCLTDTVNDNCGNPDTLAYLDSVLNNIMGELLDLVCANYAGNSERCQQLAPFDYGENRARSSDFLTPIIMLSSSVG